MHAPEIIDKKQIAGGAGMVNDSDLPWTCNEPPITTTVVIEVSHPQVYAWLRGVPKYGVPSHTRAWHEHFHDLVVSKILRNNLFIVSMASSILYIWKLI